MGGDTFVLIGNGSYLNRGCEAIIRGTAEILKAAAGRRLTLHCLDFTDCGCPVSEDEEIQGLRITHLGINQLHNRIKRYSPKWLMMHAYYRLGMKSAYAGLLLKAAAEWCALGADTPVLSVGGDNFTLDYGKPEYLRAWHEAFLKDKRPVLLWGASVGPFTQDREYERLAAGHLKRLAAILAREDATVEYLESIGVKDNVYRVADPAFMMPAQKPEGFDIPENEYIGLNFSPLFEKYANSDEYIQYCSDLIKSLLRDNLKVCLVPHVTIQGSDDYLFMKGILEGMGGGEGGVVLVPPTLNAMEYKWVISRMKAFVGARTHATIAAFSTGVPVISLSYGIKSLGINRDMYGNTHYCVPSGELDAGKTKELLDSLIFNRESISATLVMRAAEMKKLALSAGKILRDIQ